MFRQPISSRSALRSQKANTNSTSRRLLSDEHETTRPFRSQAGQTLMQTKMESRNLLEQQQKTIVQGNGIHQCAH